MTEQQLEVSMEIRTLETEDSVMVWVEGSFQSQSFTIPTTDANVLGHVGPLECRKVVYKNDRSGGHLWALYPWLHGEIQVRYCLRDLSNDRYENPNVDRERTVAQIVDASAELPDDVIDRQWETLWEPTDDESNSEKTEVEA